MSSTQNAHRDTDTHRDRRTRRKKGWRDGSEKRRNAPPCPLFSTNMPSGSTILGSIFSSSLTSAPRVDGALCARRGLSCPASAVVAQLVAPPEALAKKAVPNDWLHQSYQNLWLAPFVACPTKISGSGRVSGPVRMVPLVAVHLVLPTSIVLSQVRAFDIRSPFSGPGCARTTVSLNVNAPTQCKHAESSQKHDAGLPDATASDAALAVPFFCICVGLGNGEIRLLHLPRTFGLRLSGNILGRLPFHCCPWFLASCPSCHHRQETQTLCFSSSVTTNSLSRLAQRPVWFSSLSSRQHDKCLVLRGITSSCLRTDLLHWLLIRPVHCRRDRDMKLQHCKWNRPKRFPDMKGSHQDGIQNMMPNTISEL